MSAEHTPFRHPHIDTLASQLIKRADLDGIPPSLGYLRALRLQEVRDRFDRALEFSFQLADWEKMPAEARRS